MPASTPVLWGEKVYALLSYHTFPGTTPAGGH